MYSWLLEHTAMPLVSKVTHSRFWELYREMLATERQPLESRLAAQWRRLEQLLEHAYREVPVYREAFDAAGVRPASVATPADLTRIPVTTKQVIQRNFPDRMTVAASDSNDWRYVSTRGTADRLMAIHDFGKRDRVRAAELRSLQLSGGYRVGRTMVEIPPDACTVVCGDEGEEVAGVLPHLFHMVRNGKLRDRASIVDLHGLIERGWVLRKQVYPPFGPQGSQQPREELAEYIDRLRQDRPFLLKGLATYLFELARFVREEGLEPVAVGVVKPLGSKVSGAMRRTIESAFTGQYREDYGSAEFGGVACDCERRAGLHAYLDLFLVEVVRDGRHVGDGEIGKILITDLWNEAMPFIRYEIGDVGSLTLEPCACGRTAPRLEIFGRLQDTLVTRDGRVFTPDRVMDFFFGFDGIDEFQLVERRPGEFDLTVVGPTSANGELPGALSEFLGEEVRTTVRRAKTIRPETGGKFRLVKSASYDRLERQPARA